MSNYYDWIKAAHIIFVICWMAGMFYMPRLFVYHVDQPINSDIDKLFQKMEYRLLKIIMNPSMIFTYIFGIMLVYIYGISALGVWFHIKITMVIILTLIHGFLAKCRKAFINGKNQHSKNFFIILNEVPVIIMIIIVLMVIIKPFE